ncbi:inner-membrane translocator [Oscillibacter sp. CAG:241]|nr:inner-membrane translocator [Oscillibacter sp. CAG:241]
MNKIHIAKRDTLPLYINIAIRGGAIILALLVCALVTTVLTGENPLSIYGTILKGAFGTARKSWTTWENVAILLGISLAVTPAFKMRFWNIGAEGQVLIGCLASATCMITLGDKIPNGLLLVIMFVASLGMGALWGFLPGLFKARWNTNETLFTLMMNYIATQLVAYFIIIWEVPKGAGKIGIINQDSQAGWLPTIGNQKYLLAILVVAVMTGLMYIYLNYSKQGYEIAVVGESRRTASYAGIKVDRVIIRTMALSGALCGLIGKPPHRQLCRHQGGPGHHPDHGPVRRPVRPDRPAADLQHRPHHDHHHRGRPRLHRRYGVLDGEIQPHYHDLRVPAAGGAQPRRRRDFHGLRSDPLLRRYPDGHHPVLHHRL